eukprot:4306609-Prymnesium_polylepis.1
MQAAAAAPHGVDCGGGASVRRAGKKAEVGYIARQPLGLLDERVADLDAEDVEFGTRCGQVGAEVALAAAHIQVQRQRRSKRVATKVVWQRFRREAPLERIDVRADVPLRPHAVAPRFAQPRRCDRGKEEWEQDSLRGHHSLCCVLLRVRGT